MRLRGWASKALERELGGIFSSLVHKALSPLTTSTYLVRTLGLSHSSPRFWDSRSRKPFKQSVEGIMSPVKWRGTKICFAARSEGWLGVLTGPCEGEILLNQPQEKRIFIAVVVEQ